MDCNHLAINFPNSIEELEGFQKISSGRIIDGCEACVDWILLSIWTPSANETGNVTAYYSGHFAEFRMNIQAACDSYRCFVYVSVAAPGWTSGIVAYRKISLSKMVEDLPLGKHVVGDNAYVCSEHLLTPFPGKKRHQAQNDSYNYHLSQLRIRIKMIFGRFMKKWRLFQRPLQVKLKNAGRIFMCATKLYNFRANERLTGLLDIVGIADEEREEIYSPQILQKEWKETP